MNWVLSNHSWNSGPFEKYNSLGLKNKSLNWLKSLSAKFLSTDFDSIILVFD